MSRKPHPYFGRLNRRAEGAKPGPRRLNARVPLAKPQDQPGVLWEPFRDPQP